MERIYSFRDPRRNPKSLPKGVIHFYIWGFGVLSFPWSHPVGAYFFFLIFLSLLSFRFNCIWSRLGTSFDAVMLAKGKLLYCIKKMNWVSIQRLVQFCTYDTSIVTKQLTANKAVSNLVYCLTEWTIPFLSHCTATSKLLHIVLTTYHEDAVAPLADATWIKLQHERHKTTSGCSLLLLNFVIFSETQSQKKKKKSGHKK